MLRPPAVLRLLSSLPRAPTLESSPSSSEWVSLCQSAAALTSFERVAEGLRAELKREADSANWKERISEVNSSDHPLGRQVRRLFFQEEKDPLQLRGVLTLLLARFINPALASPALKQEWEADEGRVLKDQLSLVRQEELISVAQDMHQTVITLPKELHKKQDLSDRGLWLQLEAGNKSALLLGDLLLAKSAVGLAALRPSVVELVSRAIADHSAANIAHGRDRRGRAFHPSGDVGAEAAWTSSSGWSFASLMSASCRSLAILADCREEKADEALGRFGHHLAMAVKAHAEVNIFAKASTEVPVHFDLCSAPVLLHLRSNPDLARAIESESVSGNIDISKVYESVSGDEDALSTTRRWCNAHATDANQAFDQLRQMGTAEGDAEAGQVLQGILKNLRQ